MSKQPPEAMDDEDDELEASASLPPDYKNYMTPTSFAALQAERRELMQVERPKVVEVVAWAAGNGDRSENGDYIYGKKRLREIDRRVRYLIKRLENAKVVDPEQQQGLEKVFFGATVTYAEADGDQCTVTLVGVDEADMEQGKISWISPVARALMKSEIGDKVTLKVPAGVKTLEIVDIEY